MLIDAGKAITEMVAERAKMAHEVLAAPPATWERFQQLVGEYQAYLQLELRLKELARREDDPE